MRNKPFFPEGLRRALAVTFGLGILYLGLLAGTDRRPFILGPGKSFETCRLRVENHPEKPLIIYEGRFVRYLPLPVDPESGRSTKQSIAVASGVEIELVRRADGFLEVTAVLQPIAIIFRKLGWF